MKTKRRFDFDYVRAIAMLLIVIGHAEMSDDLTTIIYSFHVPLFYFISGGVILYSNKAKKPWSHIIKGWINSMVIPAIIWELISDGSHLILKDRTIDEILNNLVSLDFNTAGLWFIPCTIFAQFFLIVFVKFQKVYFSHIGEVPLLCLLALASTIIAMFCPVIILRLLISLSLVLLGYLFEYLREKQNSIFTNKLVLLSIIPLIGVWGLCAYYNGKVDLSAGLLNDVYMYYGAAVTMCCSILIVFRFVKKEFRILSFIGQNTIAILVTHTFVRHLIIVLETRVFGTYYMGLSMAILMIVFDLPLVYLLSRFTPWLVGKYKFLR